MEEVRLEEEEDSRRLHRRWVESGCSDYPRPRCGFPVEAFVGDVMRAVVVVAAVDVVVDVKACPF